MDASPFRDRDEAQILTTIRRAAAIAVVQEWVRRLHTEEVLARLILALDLRKKFEAAYYNKTLGVNFFERWSINDRQRWRGGLHLNNVAIEPPHDATEVVMYERFGETPGGLVFGQARIRQADAELVAAGMDEIRFMAQAFSVSLNRNSGIPEFGPLPPPIWD